MRPVRWRLPGQQVRVTAGRVVHAERRRTRTDGHGRRLEVVLAVLVVRVVLQHETRKPHQQRIVDHDMLRSAKARCRYFGVIVSELAGKNDIAHILEEEDVELLEKHYHQVINEIDTNLSFELAPKHICNQTNIPEGSSWFTAVAVVLDRLNPVKTGKPRSLIVDQLRRKQSS